jgi:hypothetical protein
MRTARRLAQACLLIAPFLLTAACSQDPVVATGGAGGTSTGTGGTAPDAGPVDKAAACASVFGQSLTAAFGRLDGTVLAAVRPVDTQCPTRNSDHLVLEVTSMGEVYRLVVNILSSYGDPNVQYLAIDHALPAPAWSDGWHTGLTLDYPTSFGVHSDAFTPHEMNELADIVTDALTLGQKVSVYAESSGGDSAHKVHRNTGTTDGAIVLDADSATPRVLLFHFADQSF